MQENSFEKKVQQKMDELSFEPSDPVWQKVAMQIRQKRRRRLMYFVLPLLLVSGGLAVYFSAHETTSLKPVAQTEEKAATEITASMPDAKEDITIQQKEEEKVTETSNTTATFQKEKQTFLNQREKKEFAAQKENKTFLTRTKKANKQSDPNASINALAAAAAAEEEEEDLVSNNLHALVLQNEIDKKEGRKTENENISNPFQNKTTTKDIEKNNTIVDNRNTEIDNILKTDSSQQSIAVETKPQDSSVTASIEKSKEAQKAWQWALNGKVGISGLRSNMANVFSNENSSDFSASPSTGNNGNPQFSTSSTVSNSIAYTMGASIRRQAGKNAFVSMGLQYSYYSTQSYIGTQVDRDTAIAFNGRLESLSSYYTNTGTTSTYTNRFHYLELPLAIDYAPFKKLPLQMQHGVSIGRLLSTNALYHNQAAGLYFKTDEWVRKMSFNLFTSVEYRLFKTRSFSLLAGPQLQWAITPVQHPSEVKKQHLFFAGLQTQLRFY